MAATSEADNAAMSFLNAEGSSDSSEEDEPLHIDNKIQIQEKTLEAIEEPINEKLVEEVQESIQEQLIENVQPNLVKENQSAPSIDIQQKILLKEENKNLENTEKIIEDHQLSQEKTELQVLQETQPMDIDNVEEKQNLFLDREEENFDDIIAVEEDEEVPDVDDYEGISIANKSVKFKRALSLIKKNEWNSDAWTMLMNEINFLSYEEKKKIFQLFLERFPMAGRWWKVYCELEVANNNLSEVQLLLTKSLLELQCPNVELWKFYLNFTKITKLDVMEDLPLSSDAVKAARKLMTEAYELAIEKVGFSIHSNPIWTNFITFLKQEEDSLVLVRKVYHQAISIPMHNMETLWKDYEAFEKAIPNNENLTQNFLKLYKPKNDLARAVFKDRKALWDGLNPNLLAVPPKEDDKEDYQLNRWQMLIEFEIQNPERVDFLNLKSRVRFAFEQSLCCKRFNPEVWYKYFLYEQDSGDYDNAVLVLKRAIEVLPKCYLLHFAFSDFYASRNKPLEGKAIYEQLVERNPSPLVYIMFQRYVKRAFGPTQGLEEARNVFKLARKDDREGAFSYHVFVASAMMEFSCDPSDSGKMIALKIFELGLKKFIQEPDYILAYLDFLGQLNDDNNTRSLFEKVLSVMPSDKARPIWDRFLSFESNGDLEVVSRIETRKAETYSEDPFEKRFGLLRIAHRYQFLNLKPDSQSDKVYFKTYDQNKKTKEIQEEQINSIEKLKGPTVPDFLVDFVGMLPLPESWNGPTPDIGYVIQVLSQVALLPRSYYEEKELMATALKKKTRTDTDDITPIALNKRPINDVFRSRQQQKMAKLNR